jgi:acetyltransferase-like isoleucine patch superfamily enzyme
MPGVKIAPGSFLAAGMVVEKDTTENSFIYQKTALQKKPNQKTAPIRD